MLTMVCGLIIRIFFGCHLFLFSSRSRKIRCDGGKPKCQKCARRSSECTYDAAPKRRGPDKKPGARQRTSKKAKAAQDEAIKRGENLPDEPLLVPPQAMPNDIDGMKRRRKGSNTSQLLDSHPIGVMRGVPSASTSIEGAHRALSTDESGLTLGLSSVPTLAGLTATPVEKLTSRLLTNEIHPFSHLVS